MWSLIKWFLNTFFSFFSVTKKLEPLRIIPYENLFPLGMKKEDILETLDNIVHKRVVEQTPDGIVDMEYEDGTFLYWSLCPVNYKYLEVVARKYVILYDKKEVYINIFRQILEVWEEVPEPQEGPFIPSPVGTGIKKRINCYRRVGRRRETIIVDTSKKISYEEFLSQKTI